MLSIGVETSSHLASCSVNFSLTCRISLLIMTSGFVRDWIERNVSCNLFHLRYKTWTYRGKNKTWFSRNENPFPCLCLVSFNLKSFSKLCMGFFLLRTKVGLGQNHVRLFLSNKYLKSHVRTIKENTVSFFFFFFFLKKKIKYALITIDWRF